MRPRRDGYAPFVVVHRTDDRALVAGRYKRGERLGHGGFGVVWRAHDTLLQRDVAVKEILFPPSLDEEEQAALREKVFREARAAARMTHPGLVTVFDVVEEEGRPLIVMELVDAPTLSEHVIRSGPLADVEAAELGMQVLDALTVAHAHGIVHRDVKPANVMVHESGRVQLADFGVASMLDDPKVTSSGQIAGSPAYMAPEQAHNRPSSPATDLWGLGATLYFAVEGLPPFDKGGALATLTSVVNDPPRPPRRAGRLAPLLADLMAKDPADRPRVEEVRRRLLDVADGAAGPSPDRDPTESLDLAMTMATATEAARAPVAEPLPVERPDPRLVPPDPAERAGGVADGAEPDRAEPDAAVDLVGAEPARAEPADLIGAEPVEPVDLSEGRAAPVEPGVDRAAPVEPGVDRAVPIAPAEVVNAEAARAKPAEPVALVGAEPDRAEPARPVDLEPDGADASHVEHAVAAPDRVRDEPAPMPIEPVDVAPAATPEPSKPAPLDPAPAGVRDVDPAASESVAPVEPPRPSPVPADSIGLPPVPTRPVDRPEPAEPAPAPAPAAPAAARPAAPAATAATAAPARSTPRPSTRGTNRRRRTSPAPIVAILLVLVVLAALLAVLVSRNSDDGTGDSATGAGRSPTTAAAATATTAKAASGSASASVPKGWVQYRDPDTGYTIAHPEAWTVSRNGTLTDIRDPVTRAYLRIDHQQPPGPSPEGAWQTLEPSFAADYPTYQRIQITPTTFKGYRAAIWEFTYSDGGADLHAVDLGFIAGNFGFALNFQTRAADWDRMQSTFDQLKDSFKAPT